MYHICRISFRKIQTEERALSAFDSLLLLVRVTKNVVHKHAACHENLAPQGQIHKTHAIPDCITNKW